MTTKTMDGEEYLANLESADEQNYGVTDIDVTHSEYIKKSDVLTLIQSRLFNQETKDGGYVLSLSPTISDEVKTLQTINPAQVIDEMIEDEQTVYDIYKIEDCTRVIASLQELKQRLSITK